MPASVPELTKRTVSMDGKASTTICASSFSASVGAPKLVPLATADLMAATTSGCA